VVVKLAAALWRSALGASRQVCFGAVLLTGSGSQSNHFGGVPWMPGWMQTQGIEALLWDSELRSIGIQPQQGQVGAAVFNTKFVPSPFLSAPLWSPVSSQGSTVTGPPVRQRDWTMPPLRLGRRPLPCAEARQAGPQVRLGEAFQCLAMLSYPICCKPAGGFGAVRR
jgi:hypothetical protein